MAARTYPRRYYRKGPPPMRIDPTRPVTLQNLKTALAEVASAEEWSDTRRSNRWSYLRRAVENALANGACDVSDLRPALNLLPNFAPPPDGPSSVRKTVSLVFGKTVQRYEHGYHLDEERWAPLIAATQRRGGGRIHFSILESLLRSLGAWDDAPTRMPDVRTLREAVSRLNLAASTFRAVVATYREARERLLANQPELASEYAPIPRIHQRSLGLETLPADVLTPVLRGAGVTRHPADMSSLEILEIVAPTLHSELTVWKRDPRRGERPGHVTLLGEYHTERCVIRMAAGLLLAGRAHLLRDVSLLGLWHPSEPPFEEDASDKEVLARVRQFAKLDVPVLHSPVQVALDAIAPLSRELAGADGGKYTSSTVVGLQRLWTLTAGLYRMRVLNANPHAWHELERHYHAVLAIFRYHEATPRATRDKTRVLELVSLPQLVCLGFPLLDVLREQERTNWLAVHARASATGHDPALVPTVRRAHDAYAESAETRLVPGIYVADGLRLNNYRNGILGVNYLIEFVRDPDGVAVGLASVTTAWTGDDRALARTKRGFDVKSKRGGRRSGIANRKMTVWPAAYVPLDALWQYLSEVTLPRAIQAGTLAPTATVEDMVKAKCVPVFLSKKCNQGELILPSGDMIGVQRAGRALWWTAKCALGRDIPDWGDLSRTDDFYRILVGHDIRLLASCWWGKVLDDWEYAAFLTNDRVGTLQNEYNADAYARWAEAGGDRMHWDHPRAFEKEMLCIRDDRGFVPDPASYTVTLPPATKDLLARLQSAPSKQSSGRRQIRRARPGQPPPPRASATRAVVKSRVVLRGTHRGANAPAKARE